MWKLYREVTDEEWECVRDMIPELRPRGEKRGRKGVDARAVLNGALWVLVTNKSWAELPDSFPPYKTCHRRWTTWCESGEFERIVKLLFGAAADDLMATVRRRRRSGGAVVRRTVGVVWRR